MVGLDALLVCGAYAAVLVLRFDGQVPALYWDAMGPVLGLVVAAHLISNWAWSLYGQMWRHASMVEARRVVASGLTVIAAMLLVRAVITDRQVPDSVLLLGGLVTTALHGVLRFHSRLFAFNRRRRADSTLVAVVGAGEAGAAIVRDMQRHRAAGLVPSIVIDDDPRKQGRSIAGVPIVGGIDELPALLERHGVRQVVLAIASADGALVRRVALLADLAGAALKVVPSVQELFRVASVRDVRDLQIDDLLGRTQIETDLESVRELLTGRRVLVTGGGGSIGAEIVRQVALFEPSELLVLDNDETHLHDAAGSSGARVRLVLADVRDGAAIEAAFQRHRPEVVFHAAALKHVPILEDHPLEAISTNVLGTHNVVSAAARHGVDRFVFISTDKAVRPSSLMGASKWLGEQMVLEAAPHGAAWCAVRFGNVLGSRGSVIPTFARQIAAGGPVTVTDPRMTRFFMSIPEAVQLVLQAAALCDRDEVFMLKMGEPVNILSLAERMIRLSGRSVGTDIEIRVTGIRPGEKLHEELHLADEHPQATEHPDIVRLRPGRIAAERLRAALAQAGSIAGSRDAISASRLLRTLPVTVTFDGAVVDLRVPPFDLQDVPA